MSNDISKIKFIRGTRKQWKAYENATEKKLDKGEIGLIFEDGSDDKTGVSLIFGDGSHTVNDNEIPYLNTDELKGNGLQFVVCATEEDVAKLGFVESGENSFISNGMYIVQQTTEYNKNASTTIIDDVAIVRAIDGTYESSVDDDVFNVENSESGNYVTDIDENDTIVMYDGNIEQISTQDDSSSNISDIGYEYYTLVNVVTNSKLSTRNNMYTQIKTTQLGMYKRYVGVDITNNGDGYIYKYNIGEWTSYFTIDLSDTDMIANNVISNTITLNSATAGSNKKFKLSIDDDGTLISEEVL